MIEKKLVLTSLIGVMCLASASVYADTPASQPSTRQVRDANNLGETVLRLVQMRQEAEDLAVADANTDRSDAGAAVRARFSAAKYLWLLRSPRKAIEVLERTRSDFGARTPPGVSAGVTTGVQASFWIACISRQCGDTARAEKEYAELANSGSALPPAHFQRIFPLAYLGEIQLQRGDVVHAAETYRLLPKSDDAKHSLDQGLIRLLDEWTDYEVSRASGKNPAMTLSSWAGDSRSQTLKMLATFQLVVQGVLSEPRPAFHRGAKGEEHLLLLQMSIDAVDSPLDRSLALFLRGQELESRGDKRAAGEAYMQLFEEGRGFSPEGALGAARCAKALGDSTGADSILQKLDAMYPQYRRIGATNPR